MKKIFLMLVVFLLLTACMNQEQGQEEHSPAEESSGNAIQNESDQEKDANKDDEAKEADSGEEQQTAQPKDNSKGSDDTSGQEIDFFDITEEEWQTLQLSKTDFDAFLDELLVDEEGLFNEVAFDGQTIEFVLKSADGESIENQITAHFMDALVRAFYMRSDYYQNEKQPLIIFSDAKGVLILENDKPLEEEEEEEEEA